MRLRSPLSRWLRPFVFAVAYFAALSGAPAGLLKFDSAGVRPRDPEVGETVTLTYKIQDALSFSSPAPRMPETIQAGGMTFFLRGSKQERFGGLHYFRATYTAVADESGAFRVPAVSVSAGGEKVRTRPLSFTVGGKVRAREEKPPFDPRKLGGTPRPAPTPVARPSVAPTPRAVIAPAAPGRSTVKPAPAVTPVAASTSSKPASFKGKPTGVLEVAGDEVFVGQAVPVKLEFLLPAGDQFEGLTRPLLAGDGFTASALEELPVVERVTNGTGYKVVTLTGTIVPFRAGTIRIPDVALKGRRLDAGSFGPAFRGQFPAPSAGTGWQDFAVPVAGREFEVADLPAEGRPPHFTGAIGEFRIQPLEISPKEAKEGEPVVLKVKLQGRGNFASVSKPRLAGEEQWRVYGPKDHFEPGQNTKTFEFTLVARTKQEQSPSASLAYFDPVQKKYFTLEWPAIPVDIAGPGEGTGFEAVTAPTVETRSPKDAPGRRGFDPRALLGSWSVPWSRVRDFSLSLVLFTLLFFFAARFLLRRRRQANEMLKAAISDAWDRLEHAGKSPSSFYTAASGVITARLALWRGKSGAFDDAAAQLNRLVSNVPLREELAAILARRDELNYGAAEPGILEPGESAAVRAALEKFCEDVA